MMKRSALATILLLSTFSLFAQRNYTYTDEKPPLPPNRVFIGSGLGLGFSSGSFNVGLNPEIGYSATQWLDAGLAFNVNYYSISADYNYGVKQSSFNYGGGPFVRLFPVKFLFVQGQYEHNWVNYTLKNELNGGATSKYTTTSSSVLAGIGYAQRVVGQANFYTVLLFDLGGDKNSPYTDSYGSSYPFIRAGFNFYLKPSRKK